MSSVKFGYMGIPFSNTEEMSHIFCKQMGIEDAEFVPLMCAADTVSELLKGNVDYGVLATRNKFAGEVAESANALRGHDEIEIVETGWIPIHHCVFLKNEGAKVKKIVSHIQAILQSDNSLRELYPDAEREECEDTAYAAEMLANGTLPDYCVAVCRKDAGEHYGLYLAHENIEDNKENMTQFSLIRLK